MTCPQCQSELVKGKTGYLCLNCGYSGKALSASKSKTKPLKPAKAKPLKPPVAPPAPTAPPVAPPAEDDMFEIPEEPADEAGSPIHHNSTEAMVEKELSRHTPEIAAQAAVVHIASQHQPEPPLNQPAPVTTEPIANSTVGLDQPAPEPALAHHRSIKRQPVRTITLIVVSLIVLVAILAAYILPARAAAKTFSTKLANADSYHFSGALDITGNSFLSVLDSNLTFDGNYTDKGRANQLAYTGTFASRNYTGTLIAKNSNLYSQMSGNDLPFIRFNQGIATYHITPNDWYQTKIDNSLYKYYCETQPETKYPSPLVWYQAIRQIRQKPSPLIEYADKIDGHTTTHLRGQVAGKDLNNAWTNINNSLPSGCQWSNLVGDVSGLQVTYDLYTSKSYDQIQLHFNDKQLGITGSMIIKLDQYNTAPSVITPVNTKSLADIFSGRAAIQARDFQRRSDVDSLRLALNKYFIANKQKLPTNLAKLAPQFIAVVPKDPNGSDYRYTVVKKTYTLSATLEDAGQLYTVSGP